VAFRAEQAARPKGVRCLPIDTFIAATRARDALGEHGADVVFDLAGLRDAA
jgi:hypothetical protein